MHNSRRLSFSMAFKVLFAVSVALRIHLSDSTRIALDVLGGFDFVCRGLIEVKVQYAEVSEK